LQQKGGERGETQKKGGGTPENPACTKLGKVGLRLETSLYGPREGLRISLARLGGGEKIQGGGRVVTAVPCLWSRSQAF